MTDDRLEEIRAGYESRRGTDAWGIWPEEAMRDLLAEIDRLKELLSVWLIPDDDD